MKQLIKKRKDKKTDRFQQDFKPMENLEIMLKSHLDLEERIRQLNNNHSDTLKIIKKLKENK